MRVLITRPFENALPLAHLLEKMGHTSLIDSLIHIIPVNVPPFLPLNFQAVVTTSQYAVRRLAEIVTQRDMPLWCAGSESVRVAKNLDFSNTHNGGGTAEYLVSSLVQATSSCALPYLYLSGTNIRVDVIRKLTSRGLCGQRLIVYDTRESGSLQAKTVTALKTRNLDAILFYSMETARVFEKLCRKANLESDCKSVMAMCLSDSIARQISHLPWLDMQIAKKPATDDLLMLLMMSN